MALESVFTRIYAALDEELTGFTLSADEKTALVRAVLESDLADFRGGLGAIELTFSFRATEEPHYRLLTNVVLEDRLVLAVAGTAGVAETLALAFTGRQLMTAKLSKDAETGCTATFDLCVDADPEDDDAGSFLVADEGKTLAWDTEIALDVYPCDHVVLRMSLASTCTGGLRAVRMRVGSISKSLTASQVRAVAQLAARRYYRAMENRCIRAGGDPQTLANLKTKIAALGREALGLLPGSEKTVTGNLGGPVGNVNAAVNKYWDRLKG